jgi:type I restriction enzyme, S subunit
MDYVSEDKYQELKRHSYRNGDIIMTKLGDPLGASAIIEGFENGLIVADLVRIRAQKVDTCYLCYHLNSPLTNNFINTKQQGATRPRVQISAVRELPIFVPPLAEQKRIVAILDEAFEGIALAAANAEKNLAGARELFESYLNSVFTHKSDGWELQNIGSICKFQGGGTPSTEKHQYWGGDIPWVSPKDMKADEIGTSIDKITPEAIENSATSLIPAGSILIVVRSGILARTIPTALTTCDLTVNQDIKAICPIKGVHNRFLHYSLKSAERGILKLITRGATVHRLSTDSLKAFPISVPALPEQMRIVATLDDMRAETRRLESLYRQKLSALAELKQSLLQKAFAGELTAERQSERMEPIIPRPHPEEARSAISKDERKEAPGSTPAEAPSPFETLASQAPQGEGF